jgi:hypothetical protein
LALQSTSTVALTEVPYQKLKTSFAEEENMVLVRDLPYYFGYFYM